MAKNESMIDRILDPAMVVDSNMKINMSNLPAEKFLKDQNLFTASSNNMLRITDALAQEGLCQLVRLTCSGLTTLARLDDILIRTSTTTQLITAIPILPSQSSLQQVGLSTLFSERALVLLIIRPRTTDRSALIAKHASETFKLTHAETKLVLEFEKGGTLHEIAQRLGVSRSTVHSQLKAIFIKTGTSKQRDMISLLLNATASRKTFTIQS